ncbi:LOW QUALITY PROTEIN: cytokine receptor common subunit beta-like [Leptosomus discolor]
MGKVGVGRKQLWQQKRPRLTSSEEGTRDVDEGSFSSLEDSVLPYSISCWCAVTILDSCQLELPIAAKSCVFPPEQDDEQQSSRVPWSDTKTVQVSHATLAPRNSCQTSRVPHKTSLSSSALVCPVNQTAGPSCLFARLPCKSAAHASVASQTCFAFNGPYLYSPVTSSQPDMHQTLEADPVGVCEKSFSLQYVTLPKSVGNSVQAPQRQEQPEACPPEPFLIPDQKEMMQHLDVSPAPPACGKGTNMQTEEQKTPKALRCITSPQQCPLEYITTESLVLPPGRDSTHPPLVTAGELPCDSEPQPHSDRPCHEFSPGKSGVIDPVSGQAPTSSPELHLDTFGDYLTVPSCPHGHSEPTKISLPVLQKGNDLLRKQPLSAGNLVVLNPDSTEPVFLCQVGDYCFHSLKSTVKMDSSQEDHQVENPSEGKAISGKPVSGDESATGKEKAVSKMQAIQLFKNLKSDDYFSWQQSLRITEIC